MLPPYLELTRLRATPTDEELNGRVTEIATTVSSYESQT
jgi:hypothetical protein